MLLAESTSPTAPLRARMIDNYNQFRLSITWLLGQAQEEQSFADKSKPIRFAVPVSTGSAIESTLTWV